MQWQAADFQYCSMHKPLSHSISRTGMGCQEFREPELSLNPNIRIAVNLMAIRASLPGKWLGLVVLLPAIRDIATY